MPKPKDSEYIRLNSVPKLLLELTGVTRIRGTVYHWVKYGRIDSSGKMLKLKARKRLGTYYTTRQWVLDFIGGIG